MAKDLIIPGQSVPFFGSEVPADQWDSSDTYELEACLLKLHVHDSVTLGEIEILTRGMDHTETRAQVLSSLLYPQCKPVLEDLLEHQDLSIPGLDSHTRVELINIAQEDDESTRVWDLGKLLINRLQDANKIDLATQTSYRDQHDAVLPRGALAIGVASEVERTGEAYRAAKNNEILGSPPDLDHLLDLTFEGKTDELIQAVNQMPEATIVELEAAGKNAVPVLVTLVDHHPDLSGTASELLYELGDDVIPILRKIAPHSPGAQSIISAIITGEKPSTAMPQEHIDSLIEMLNSSDRDQRDHAVEMLRDFGADAVNELTLARADPSKREAVDQLLREIFTGDSSDTQSDNLHPFLITDSNNPFRLSDLVEKIPLGRTISHDQPILDVKNLEKLLSDSSTSLSTLNALVQIGAPAVPALCELLMRTR